MKRLKHPPENWVKCNVGLSWSKQNHMVGAAWVLRNSRGRVMIHSKRCFENKENHDETKLLVVMWAMESMAFHGVENVIFAFEFSELVGAVTRPKAWPSFAYQSEKLLKILERFQNWKLMVELREPNRRTFLIGQSVTKDLWFHSYVAVRFPEWIHDLFVS